MTKQLKTVVPLVTSAIFSVVVLLLAREYLNYDGLADDMGAWGIFFAVFGILYAIVAGFLLVSVIERFSNLSSAIEEEINSLQDIRDFLGYLDNQEKVRKGIRKALKDYAQSVVDKEWVAMSDLSVPTDSDTTKELHDLISATNKVGVANESDGVALTVLIEEISKVTTIRTKRINLSNETLPPRLVALVVFMSLVLMFGFVMMAVVSVWIHLVMVVSMTIAVHLIYLVLSDLNTPFDGSWNVSRTHFEEFADRMK